MTTRPLATPPGPGSVTRLRISPIPRSAFHLPRSLGRLRVRWWAEDAGRPTWQGLLWGLALAILLVGLALQLGAGDWYTDEPIAGPDGTLVRLPNVYASIDHPFHVAKERATVDALRRGWLPRWFSNHQGGFPAEFYPTGGDVIVAALYGLGLGRIPLGVAHKLVVIGTLFLPPLAFWLIARRERLPLSVALLASVLHLFVRGSWLAGGSRQVVDYGLWPDAFASYMPLFVILWGADWLRRGDRRGLVLAAGAATLAIYTNPRSVLGIATACAALGLVAASEHVRLRGLWRLRTPWTHLGARAASRGRGDRPATLIGGAARWISGAARRAWPLLVGRGVVLALLVMALSAAILLPLRAHQELYHFTVYFRFETPDAAWKAYHEAMQVPLLRLALLGFVVGFLRRGFYGRVLALLLPLSFLTVVLAGFQFRDVPVFAQLEGPRLMPLLRPATIFLAALGVHETARAILRLVQLRGATMLAGVATVAVAVFLLLSPRSPLEREVRGLPLLETTDQPAFTRIARSAFAFAAAARPDDKPLIMGNPISWHASFWVPALTGRDVFHNDWLWFWRTVDYGGQELLSDEVGALEQDFLARHGLTMVLLDVNRGDLLDEAAKRPHLRQLDPGSPGGYALYRVVPPPPYRGEPQAPNGWVSLVGGDVTTLEVAPERLVARGQVATPGMARIIINHFPRWRATVNGEPVAIERSLDGYILVPVPAGDVTIELDYVTETVDWLARALVAFGALLLLAIGVRPARLRRRRVGGGKRVPAPEHAGQITTRPN